MLRVISATGRVDGSDDVEDIYAEVMSEVTIAGDATTVVKEGNNVGELNNPCAVSDGAAKVSPGVGVAGKHRGEIGEGKALYESGVFGEWECTSSVDGTGV